MWLNEFMLVARIITLSLIVLCSVSTAATIDLATGLVGEFLFNSSASDSSGNGNNGTIYNLSSTFDRFGTSGAAYNFSGNASYVAIPTLIQNIAAGATLFSWIKVDPSVQSLASGSDFWLNIISQPRSNLFSSYQRTGFRLQIYNGYSDGDYNGGYQGLRLNAGYNDDTGLNGPAQNVVVFGPNNSSVADGQWHSVAATLKTDETSRVISVYLDGVFASSEIIRPDPITADAPFYIGTEYDPNNSFPEPRPFIGSIDDVRVYNRALSSDEIQALHLVPEPSSLSLLLAGGAVALFRRRKS